MHIKRNQKNVKYFTVAIGQVPFWGCKGHHRKWWQSHLSQPLPPPQERLGPVLACSLLVKLEEEESQNNQQLQNTSRLGEKKKSTELWTFLLLNVKLQPTRFKVFGETEADTLKKHTRTLHLKCSQAIHDDHQRDLIIFF